MKRTIIFLLFILALKTGYSQSVDEVYTSWAKREIPVAHENIESMVLKLWGGDASKAAPLIEAHCKSLNKILMKVQNGNINTKKLQVALDKWSRSPEDERSERWWEWPNTNWIRVESEYKKLIEEDS